jgi:hypothetical protein
MGCDEIAPANFRAGRWLWPARGPLGFGLEAGRHATEKAHHWFPSPVRRELSRHRRRHQRLQPPRGLLLLRLLRQLHWGFLRRRFRRRCCCRRRRQRTHPPPQQRHGRAFAQSSAAGGRRAAAPSAGAARPPQCPQHAFLQGAYCSTSCLRTFGSNLLKLRYVLPAARASHAAGGLTGPLRVAAAAGAAPAAPPATVSPRGRALSCERTDGGTGAAMRPPSASSVQCLHVCTGAPAPPPAFELPVAAAPSCCSWARCAAFAANIISAAPCFGQ